MAESGPKTDRALLARLSTPAEAADLAERAVGFLLEQPIARFVSPESVLAHLEAALGPPLLERVLTLHVRAFCDRDHERAKERGDRVADYLTPEALELLRRELGKPVVLDRLFLEAFVKQDAVRHLLRAVVQETVQRFVQALKPGGKNGLFGGLPKGPGLGLLTRMADQLEAQIQRAAAAFVSTSLEVLLGRLVIILSSPETAEQLGRLRLAGLEAILPLRTRMLWSLAHRMPLDEALALASAVVRHNLERPELRQAVLAEAGAVLAEEGARPLAELVAPQAAARWRTEARERAPALLADFLASEGFQEWLGAPGWRSETKGTGR